MAKNNIGEWRSRREWLDDNEYTEELKAIGNELYVIRSLIMDSSRTGDYFWTGISSLLDTLAVKCNDLAHGRLQTELLPE